MTESKKNMSNLMQRIIMALVGGGAMVGGIIWNEWGMMSILFIIGTISLTEFYNLFAKNTAFIPNYVYGLIAWTLLYWSPLLLFTGQISQAATVVICTMTLILLLPSLFIMELFRKKTTPVPNVAITLFGMFYITVPLLLLASMGLFGGTYNHQLILSIFFILWASDSGAYFAGKALGKTPLFPRVSPKKTWEGSMGGLLLAVGVAILLSYTMNNLPDMPRMCGLAIVIVVFGSLGDLCESLLKRSIEIKDSGSILPGHGGFLDRFDGLFISVPFVLIYFMLIA